MHSKSYDIITVGGGLGGSALAFSMAKHGAKVLVLERETQFKDRVRGEYMAPWGVAETQALGMYDLLMSHGGHHPLVFETRAGQNSLGDRDLSQTTSQGLHALTMYHPGLQEALLRGAEEAGADVRRRCEGHRAQHRARAGGDALEWEWGGYGLGAAGGGRGWPKFVGPRVGGV